MFISQNRGHATAECGIHIFSLPPVLQPASHMRVCGALSALCNFGVSHAAGQVSHKKSVTSYKLQLPKYQFTRQTWIKQKLQINNGQKALLSLVTALEFPLCPPLQPAAVLDS